jgi:hypothetical protein
VPWVDIIDLVQQWLTPDVRVELPQKAREATRSVAERMIRDLAACSEGHPGVQHRLAEMASRSGVEVPTMLDPGFEQLYPKDSGAYRDFLQSAQRETQQLAKIWLQRGAEWSACELARVEAEARIAGVSFPNLTTWL